MVLNPKGKPEGEETIQHVLLFYNDPKHRWQNADYLSLGIHEHHRLLGVYPTRDAMAAWLYHAAETNDEETGAVAFLRDSQALGFTFDDAESYVIPLIRNSHPSLESSSVVGDMRLATYGQRRASYFRSARKMQAAWKTAGIEGEAWRLGRIAALVALLGRKRLYFRDEFEKVLAATARENMKAELDLLGYVPPPTPPPEPTPTPADRIIVLNPDMVPIKLSDLLAKNKAAQAPKEGEKTDEVSPPGPGSPPPPPEEPRPPGPIPSDRGEG